MVNTFKNALVEIGITATVLYTAPGSTSSIMTSLHIANKHASNSENLTVELTDASAAATFILADNMPIPVGGALDFDKPINLETGDIIKVTASTAASLVANASILEIS